MLNQAIEKNSKDKIKKLYSELKIQREGNNKLRYWILLAICLSLISHIFLIYSLKKIDIPDWGAKAIKVYKITKVKDVYLDESVDKKLEEFLKNNEHKSSYNQDEKNLSNLPRDLDFYEIQKLIPQTEINITPSVKNIENFMIAEKSEIYNKDSVTKSTESNIDNNLMQNFEKTIETYKEDMIKENSIGDSVPKIIINSDSENLKAKDFLVDNKLMTDMLNKNIKVMEGYSNINHLLSQGGSFPDGSKPILMPADLLFSYNSYELKEESRYSLMKIGYIIQKNPSATFIFEGHADLIGSEDYNMELSKKRANAVKKWLSESLFINESRMSVKGYGKTRPLIKKGSKDEQMLNRRVEISVKYN